MRLKRRSSPGGTGILSSAGSLDLPVGSLFRPGSVEGYYIDFTSKADDPAWPPRWLAPRIDQVHVGTVQWALGCYERFLAGDGERWKQAALETSDYLVSEQESDGGWPHLHRMQHTYRLEPPWLSAMAQGEGASLLVRAQLQTGDQRYGEAALKALEPMNRSTQEGGLLAQLDGAPFLEEYPTTPSSYVLNGAIFALWGYYDVGLGLPDQPAADAFERMVTGLADRIGRFDAGYWSLYDLFPHLLANVASPAYHTLHINQLKALNVIAPRREFEHAIARFEAYLDSPVNRARSFAHKAAFRILIPRNELIGDRVPWRGGSTRSRVWRPSRRPAEDRLVLGYHALSPTWESPLAVTPERFEQQIRYLLGRGYRGTTFHEAVRGEAGGKQLAITFDDAYCSVLELGLPILRRLSVPATVFVTTAFAAGDRLLAWPGIEQWQGGPDEKELLPMSWEQLRSLAAVGWEIGSHTRTHPRLPELDDARLESELSGSRIDCETNLEQPCRSLAYPYGAHDPRVVAAARSAGYSAAGTLPARLHEPAPLRWPRIGVYRADDEKRFRRKSSPRLRTVRATRGWELAQRLRGARSSGTS